jgi:hypothetical protein
MTIDGSYRPEVCAGVSPDAVRQRERRGVFETNANARSDR